MVMAGLLGWWGLSGVDAGGHNAWLLRNEAADMRGESFDETLLCGVRLVQGVGRCHTWLSSGIRAVLLGHAYWKGGAITEAALQEFAMVFRSSGADALKSLSGQFLVAVVDSERRQGLVAVDRLGCFPLAYSIENNGVVFGSDARSVAGHPFVRATLSNQSIFSYLYAHMVPSPDTIFEGVAKLEPGQYLRLESQGVFLDSYWHMSYATEQNHDFGEYSEKFHALLRESVRRNLDGDEFGCFLSGGTDSSTVSGVAAEVCRGTQVDAYSIGFNAEGFDETGYAKLAASHFGCKLHDYYVTPSDVCDAIPKVAAAYDEPFGNASAVPTYFCALRAKQDGKRVLLAGDGGDEIFGGNARYAKQKVFEAYWLLPNVIRQRMVEPVVTHFPLFSLAPFSKVRSYVDQAKIPLPDRLESYNFLEREDVGKIFSADFLRGINRSRPVDIARRSYGQAPEGQSVNRMMHLDLKQTLADNDLRKVVRMCALAGVEVRFPLLDDGMVEFAGGLPEHWKVNRLKLRWFFKEALKDFLPQDILTKTKHGFGLPFGLWMTTDPRLQGLAYDSLNQLKSRGIVQPRYLDQLIDQHRSGHASYYGVMIWVLMMLEQWFQANKNHLA